MVKNVWRSGYDLGGWKTGYHGYWAQDWLDIDPLVDEFVEIYHFYLTVVGEDGETGRMMFYPRKGGLTIDEVRSSAAFSEIAKLADLQGKLPVLRTGMVIPLWVDSDSALKGRLEPLISLIELIFKSLERGARPLKR